ncbi:hypothetical protein BGZ99_002171 [Dissophora globulifera]|uniref:Uncharacterized protein n=1 Tax=Dissophora globulifera TaxID=979702 RepID=A0A9P6QYW5_9FUNG|nr:hypothetical protein BGZ99_002171 [Dissophora globulifera]
MPTPLPVLDIRTLLPAGFGVRDQYLCTLLPVTPLPVWLEEHLEDEKARTTSDLFKLLSQAHLEFMYVRTLRPARPQLARAEETHSIWAKAMPLLKLDDAFKAPDGYSHTISTHIRQFTTSVSNLWEGPTYYRSLEYLIRILLRIHLAPEREKRQQDRAARGHQRLRQQKEVVEASIFKISRSTWRWKMARLWDKLAITFDSNKPKRVQAILRQLYHLQAQEPTASGGNLPNLEQQLIRISGKTLDQCSCADDATCSASVEITATDLSQQVELNADGEAKDDDFADLEDLGDLDELDDLDDADDTANDVKDSSAPRLRALQCVLKMLLESPSISSPVDKNYVAKTAHKGKTFTDNECSIVARLFNLLQKYVPKRRRDDNGHTSPPLGHVALRAPVVMIANAVMRATHYTKFSQTISPQISMGTTQALCMGAREVYETFCGSRAGRFDIKDAGGTPITTTTKATSSAELKKATFGAFLDLNKIENICRQYGLRFANRVTFVDKRTIIITGHVIPHGSDRRGHPVRSHYDERKKGRSKRQQGRDWVGEFNKTGLTKEHIEQCSLKAAEDLADAKANIKKLRKDLANRETTQTTASRALAEAKRTAVAVSTSSTSQHSLDVADSTAATSDHIKNCYKVLQHARQEVRSVRVAAFPQEEALRHLSYQSYYWNKLLIAARSTHKMKGTDKTSSPQTLTEVTWTQCRVEDTTDLLNINQLCNSPRGRVVFGGTDYGVCKMSVTVPQTMEDIEQHLGRYQALVKGKLSGHFSFALGEKVSC